MSSTDPASSVESGPAPTASEHGPAPSETSGAVAAAATASVPRWAIHRRLYDWTLSLAHHRHSTTALFLLSFAESSFFPVPPDVLQIALTLERRNRAWWYATVSTVASVLGGLFGYVIGWGLWHLVEGFFYRWVFSEETFATVVEWYDDNAMETIFLAAFTPVPFKVFTVAAGVCAVSIPALLIASVIGRGLRFYLVALLMWWFGPPVKRLIDRYFNLVCLIFGVLLVGGVVLIRVLR